MYKGDFSVRSMLFLDDSGHGRLQLIVNTNLQDGSEYGIIENVFVEKEYRNKGIATSLIERAIEYSKESGLYKIVLNCSDKNVDLYHKCGFKIYQYNMRHFL